jgi:hypothetical protein
VIDLASMRRCFTGVVPSFIGTCAADGTPNVTYLSHVHYIDDRHVALSCQFFNKTRRNVAENPHACVHTHDPVTLDGYELHLRFDHAETTGPLFEAMSVRIQAIASHTGMMGVFRLLSADVYEVVSVRRIDGFLDEGSGEEPPLPLPAVPSFRTELGALQCVSERLRRANDLDELLSTLLSALRAELGFEHSIVLLVDERGDKLYTVASHGYGANGAGAEVAVGEGLIGAVAEHRRTLRVSDVDREMRYGRAIRRATRTAKPEDPLSREIPLPGLPDAQSHLAIPLVAHDRLVGVLAVESPNPLAFADWHEPFLDIIGNQVAVAIEYATLREDAAEAPHRAGLTARARPQRPGRTFCFYKNDDCVFVDGEYLIRNVPGRILWKLLRGYEATGRTEHSNRELRLDRSLGLPAVKDNLESRLILLRKRLEQQCPDLRIVSTSRGHFRLEVDCGVTLIEKDSA